MILILKSDHSAFSLRDMYFIFNINFQTQRSKYFACSKKMNKIVMVDVSGTVGT